MEGVFDAAAEAAEAGAEALEHYRTILYQYHHHVIALV